MNQMVENITKSVHKKSRAKIDIQKSFLFLTLFAVILGFSLINPRFASPANVVNILRKMSESMIIAVGMTFCLISGGVDLSVGKIGVMAGCLAGVIFVKMQGLAPEAVVVTVAIVASLLAGTLYGVGNGLIIAKLRVLPFIATMATMTISYGMALLLTGGDTISALPKSFTYMGTGYLFPGLFKGIDGVYGIPVSVVIMFLVVLIGQFVIRKTEFGLNVYALGGNFRAAKLAGLRNDRILICVYGISGFLSALGGLVLTARMISAQPGLWGGINLEIIAGCVIGGTSMKGGVGSIFGSLLGVLLMTCLGTGLNLAGIDYDWQQIITGVLVLVAVSLDTISRSREV
jgi:ribose transport system permease protein